MSANGPPGNPQLDVLRARVAIGGIGGGASGPTGATGPAGSPGGATGATGAPGATGAGATGAVGATGAIGATGAVGATGATGSGATGATGATGSAPLFSITNPAFAGGASAAATPTQNVAAINATIAAANAAGGTVYVPNDPAGAYRINAPISIPHDTVIVGEASSIGTPKSVLQAAVAMPAMLQVETQQNQTLPTPAQIRAITLDQNLLAIWGIDRRSDLSSRYSSVQCRNAPLDGFHSSSHSVAVAISAIVPGGGAGAGQLTLSQPDVSYAGDISSSGTHYAIKFVVAGGYGVGQFVLSQDGGVTFATARQTVQAVSNLIVTQAAQYTHAMGLQATFANIVYGLNWTYTWTATGGLEPNTSNTTINALVRFDDCSVVNLGVAYCSDAGTRAIYSNLLAQAFTTGGTVTSTPGSQLLVGTGTAFLTGSQPNLAPRPGDTIWLNNSPADPRIANFQILAVMDDFTVVVSVGDAPNLPALAGVHFALVVGAGCYVTDGGDNIGEAWHDGYMETVANGWRLSGVSPMSLYSPFLEADSAGIGVGIGGQMSAGAQTIVQAPYIKLSTQGRQYYVQQASLCEIIDPEGPFGPDGLGGSGFARVTFNGQPYAYNFVQNDFQPKANLVLQASVVSVTVPNQVLVGPPLDVFQGGATAYTVLVPNADYIGTANTPLLPAPSVPGQLWLIENQLNSAHVFEFFDNGTFGASHLNLACQSLFMFPGERMLLVASEVAGSVASWQIMGDVQRSYRGQSGEGSKCGPGSGVAIGVGTINVQLWDVVFVPTRGFAAKLNVSVKDAASASFACWLGCTVGVDGTGAIIGQFVPTTQAQGAFGSNAGLPPVGWAMQFAIVVIGGSNQVAAQVTTTGGITAKALSQSEQIAAYPI